MIYCDCKETARTLTKEDCYMKTELKKELDWGDFSDPTHDKIEHDYLPDYGEGKTKMSQAITASSKLIYRWFNDGDFFDARVITKL